MSRDGLKILALVPRIPYPLSDGGAVYIYNSLKYLAASGNSINIIGFNSNLHPQQTSGLQEFSNIKTIDGSFKKYSIWAVLKSILSHQPISIQHRMDRNKMRKLINEVSNEPDIILLEGIHTAAFINDIRNRFSQVPIVLRESNVEYLLLKRNAEVSKNPVLKAFYIQQYKAMKSFELKSLKAVDAVTAITEFDKETFLKDIPKLNCFVSPAGTEKPDSFNIERKRNRLLAISSWKWAPNYEGLKWFLNEVWPKLKDKKPTLEFDIIGAGLPKSLIKKHASTRIHFHGFVEDLETFRQTNTIFIAPLFSGSGMKIKIIEAMASGIPIVTTKIGAEGIDITHGIEYLEANSIQEFIKSIELLLSDTYLHQNISIASEKKVEEKYSLEKIGQNLTAFLIKVINQ